MSAADGSNPESGADDHGATRRRGRRRRRRRRGGDCARRRRRRRCGTVLDAPDVRAGRRCGGSSSRGARGDRGACAWTDARIADERASAMFGIPGDDSNPSESGDLPDVAERDGFSLARSPFTEHLPLHRFAAILIHAATAAERFDARLNGEENDFPSRRCAAFLREDAVASRLTRLAEHPSRALAWSDQVRARLWVRNGDEMRRAAAVYGSSRFSAGLGRDADLATTQMALATAAEPHRVSLRILELGRASCLHARPRERRGDLRTDAIEDDEGHESPRGFVHARKRAAEEASAADVAGARERRARRSAREGVRSLRDVPKPQGYAFRGVGVRARARRERW